MLDLEATLTQRAAGPDRRRQAEDLARPRPGALRRQRHHVRRAADGDRPAPEVAAARQAEGAAPARRAHDDLRHARPDRGADLRRPGGGDDRGHGGAGRHAGRAVRAAAPHLRRPLHRLARHERAALRGRRDGVARSAAMPIAVQNRAAPRRATASAPRSACGPSSSASPPSGLPVRDREGAATAGAIASSRRATATSRIKLLVAEGAALPAERAHLRFDPALHAALRRRLDRGLNAMNAKTDNQRPGGWCCRWCCWSPSTP